MLLGSVHGVVVQTRRDIGVTFRAPTVREGLFCKGEGPPDWTVTAP
jgi:hypothetical protein